MITIRAYTCMGQLTLTCNTSLGSFQEDGRGFVHPVLDAGSYEIAEDHSPVDLVQALCQMIDNIEHSTQGRLYAHLEA